MGHYKTYSTDVVQKSDQYIQDFTIAEFSLPKYSFYMDNCSQRVLKWVEEKQKGIKQNEKVIIVNIFSITNVK